MTTDFTTAHVGSTGWLGSADETTAGIYVAPNLFLPVTDNSLKAPWQFAREKSMRGTRMSHVTMERTRLKPAGTFTFGWNPKLGLEWVKRCLGASASVSAIAPVASVGGPIVTANGRSTIPVTGSFLPGTPVLVGVSAGGAQTSTTEMTSVISYTAGSLVVRGLVKNATAAAGIFVTQKALTKHANSILTGAALNTLPTATVESNKGNQWSWVFPYVFVESMEWNFSKDSTIVTVSLVGAGDPLYASSAANPSGATTLDQFGAQTAVISAYAPNSADEAQALRVMTSVDGYVSAFGDPDWTGASAVRAALGVTDCKVTFKNALIAESAMNNSHTDLEFPGDDASAMVEFNEIDTANRPDIWQDGIKNSVASTFDVANFKNYGTDSTPNWGGSVLHMPNVRYSDGDPVSKIGAVDKFSKKGEALAGAGVNDYLVVYTSSPS